ncbi:hypothetical protein F183_A28270 [Bryobacterales bacterium F-183]|nr:hypothetical protein F183_A28270 [Bryobacterales bacterium F-183]
MQATAEAMDEVVRKNREIYDNTSGADWYLTVYEGAHQGWEFINLGGLTVANRIAQLLEIDGEAHIIDVCAGQGGVSRYLAAQRKCRVTAVEWNPGQVRTIRNHLSKAGPGIASRIDVVEADATTWRADELADGAFSMDALMLTPQTGALIANTAKSLEPGATFAISVICAGEHITDAMRRFAWDIDGMIHLPGPGWYAQALEQAGFEDVVLEDCTDVAIATSETMERALRANEARIVAEAGPAVFRGWKDVGAVYLNAFRQYQLMYLFAHGKLAR